MAYSRIVSSIQYRLLADEALLDERLERVEIRVGDLMAWLEWIPWVSGLRIDHKFFYLTLILAALSIAAMRRIVHSPFGRVLTAIRDNAERAQFIGVNVRPYQLVVFSLAGGLPVLPAACSASSIAACSPISASGRSRPRC